MKRVIFIFLGLILMIGLIFLIWRGHKENTILKQALQQQEQMIKQNEEQIQQLQEQLEALQKEQVLREKKIVVLKKQRMQIQKPRDIEEIVREFKSLGYEVQIR
jgi:uncharacterized protein YxeA